ncbi:hypothetical protein BDZ89DRAFT_1100482 [Hymenopellis radicata]|nr:hypothetical protein BDZ89DRAFT_1100482 [Hymenopellis radicata]
MAPTVTRTRKTYTQTTLTSSSSSSSKTKPAKPVVAKSNSDVLLCIKPEFATLIREGKKNHEYRKYKLRDTVQRLWLYETAPVSAIRYVMQTARPKVPGEVNDPTGVGNDDFDAGKKQSKYGYPVRALWELKKPIKMNDMRTRFKINPPQGFMFVPEQMVQEEKLEDMTKLF